jgi:hypothetical protein
MQHSLNLTWRYEDKMKKTTDKNHATQILFPPAAELKRLYELGMCIKSIRFEVSVF